MPFHPVDIHVGNRIRQRRVLQGLSQTDLGSAANIAFQQVQKYERGANRCSASMLHTFATALGVHAGFFFDEMPAPSGKRAKGTAPAEDPLTKRETLELVKNYYKLGPHLRDGIFEMVKAATKDAA